MLGVLGRHADQLVLETIAVNGEPALAIRAGGKLLSTITVRTDGQHFSDQELIDLTLAIAQINAWNRLNVAFRSVPGNYRPGMYKEWIEGAEVSRS